MARPDMPRPDPSNEKTLATGQSEAEAARPVRFTDKPEAGSDAQEKDIENEPDDAVDDKRSSKSKRDAAPGAIPPDELTTETDDGAA